jgi:CelD/BcsL family acetyltransferase involved in cellulose biosynthesis
MRRRDEITLLEGAAALAWLETAAAREAVQALHRRCPWSTRFQSWEFVTIWYRCYREVSDPVLLCQRDGERLAGFLPLARDRISGRLAAAGDHQAEYQGWLAEPGDGDRFLEAALLAIGQHFRPDRLRLRYLPAKAPTGWLERPLGSGVTVATRRHQRPLFSLADPKAIAESLRKKSNKSRLSRLKRLGALELRVLETRAALEGVIDEISAGYDLRQGAANGVCPFADDPRKRRFHLELMDHPGLMQACVFSVGGRVAAAHLGLVDQDSVVVGVFGHAPAFGRHSPGKFLMLMLGEHLAASGRRWIDLTPGGAWKERFASDHDQVLEVIVFFERGLARRERATAAALAVARSSLALLGATPDDARRFARRLRPGALFGTGRAANAPAAEPPLIYWRTPGAAPAEPTAVAVARDRIGDLLLADPAAWGRSRQAFLAEAEAHLEQGHRLYSVTEDGRLLHYAWLIEGPIDGEDPASMPERAVWLHRQATLPAAAGRDLQSACLQAMLRDLDGGPAGAALALAAEDDAGRQRAAALGFAPWRPA